MTIAISAGFIALAAVLQCSYRIGHRRGSDAARLQTRLDGLRQGW